MSDKIMQACTGWCAPAVIYAVLVVIGLVITISMPRTNDKDVDDNKMSIVITQMLVGMLLTGILYFLCYTCHINWSWFVFILYMIPFFISLAIFIVSLLFILRIIKLPHKLE